MKQTRGTAAVFAAGAALAGGALVASGTLLACGGGPRQAPPSAAGGTTTTAAPSPAIIETVGDVGIIPLEAPGFDRLTPAERAMACYLVRAAVAGRDIAYDEADAASLEIRDLLEEILTHPRSLDPVFRDRLLLHLKRFWINNGNHDLVTGAKFVPDFTPDELRAGARAAQLDGAEIRLAVGEPLAGKIERLRPAIFDTTFEPMGGCRGGETTPVSTAAAAAAAATATPGATAAAAARPRQAAAVRTMTGFLAKAAGFAGTAQRADLLSLSLAVRDRTPSAAQARLEGWLALDPAVDIAAGPVTGCRSDHGRDGAWRGLVWMSDPDETRRLQLLAAVAPRLLAADGTSAPAAGAASGPSVVAASLLVAVGAAGPVAPTTVMLPDDPVAAGAGGRRCVVLGNVLAARDRALLEATIGDFAAPEDRPLLLKEGRASSFALAALHVVLGHAAPVAGHDAAPPAGHAMRPPDDAGRVLEEARADLLALQHLFDERLLATGFLTSPGEAEAALRLYLVRALALSGSDPADGRPAADGTRAARLVAAWLREHGAGVEESRSEGRLWLRVTDLAAARRGVGALLGEVEQRLAGGDRREARTFVERFATRADPALRAEIDSRTTHMGIPSRLTCVMVDLIPVRDSAGEVVDARVGPITDFALQMLRYSGKLPFEVTTH